MHLTKWFLIVIVVGGLATVCGDDGTDQVQRVRVNLSSGSRLVGTTPLDSFDVELGFQTLKVPLQYVRRLDRVIGANDTRYHVHFRNGDMLTGRWLEDSIELNVAFGRFATPVELITRIEVLGGRTEVPVREGLLLHLPFDSDDENDISARSIEDYEIRPTGIQFQSDDQRGTVAKFGGRSRIEVAHHESLCPKNLTMGGWLYPTSDARSYQMIAAKTHPSSWSGGYGFYCYPGNTIYFFVNGYHSTYLQAKIQPNRWTHVIAVCDDRSIRLYVNGQLLQQKPINQTASEDSGEGKSGGVARHAGSPLFLGADSNHDSWDGLLDDFVLYDRALGASEIRRLYRAGGVSEAQPTASVLPVFEDVREAVVPEG